MSNSEKEQKQSDDSLEQKKKANDPNQDIEPQRETNTNPKQK